MRKDGTWGNHGSHCITLPIAKQTKLVSAPDGHCVMWSLICLVRPDVKVFNGDIMLGELPEDSELARVRPANAEDHRDMVESISCLWLGIFGQKEPGIDDVIHIAKDLGIKIASSEEIDGFIRSGKADLHDYSRGGLVISTNANSGGPRSGHCGFIAPKQMEHTRYELLDYLARFKAARPNVARAPAEGERYSTFTKKDRLGKKKLAPPTGNQKYLANVKAVVKIQTC